MVNTQHADQTRSSISAMPDLAVRVLVVEDEPLVATYIADVLQESGFHVAGVASSGAEALSIAATTETDLALVDIKLAGKMDGIEVALRLFATHGVRTIFLSGANDPTTLGRAAQAHPLGTLEKPFRPSQVYNAIERAMRELGRSTGD